METLEIIQWRLFYVMEYPCSKDKCGKLYSNLENEQFQNIAHTLILL